MSILPWTLPRLDILDFGSFTGAFDAFDLPSLEADLAWDINNLLSSGGVLSVISAPAGDFDLDGNVDGALVLATQRWHTRRIDRLEE